MDERAPAVVLGMSETGLGALRLLGSSGIICYGVDSIGQTPAYRSRYCRYGVTLPQSASDDDILQSLETVAALASNRPILLPTSDRFVRLVSRCRARLGSRFQLLLPEHSLVEDLIDKDRFAQRAAAIGAPIPRSVTVQSMEDLPSIAVDLRLPIILKPARRHGSGQSPLPKVIVIEREEDIALTRDRYAACAEAQFLAQEFIPGGDGQHISVALCLDHQANCLATFTSRKQRQGNLGAGVGTYVESYQDPEAEQLAAALLHSLGYLGVAEVEFKRHANTGRLYLIEVNARVWTQVTLAGACGLNFPLMSYCLATGLPMPAMQPSRRRITWQDLWEDFYSTFHRTGYRAAGKVSCLQWFRQTLGARVGPYFALSDPLPAIAQLRFVLRQILKR